MKSHTRHEPTRVNLGTSSGLVAMRHAIVTQIDGLSTTCLSKQRRQSFDPAMFELLNNRIPASGGIMYVSMHELFEQRRAGVQVVQTSLVVSLQSMKEVDWGQGRPGNLRNTICMQRIPEQAGRELSHPMLGLNMSK